MATTRIAVLVDALNPRALRSEHPPNLVAALEALGYRVELHWVSAGLFARVDGRSPRGPEVAQLEGASTQVLGSRPDLVLAYDPACPAAWLGARVAGRLDVPLVLIEPAWFPLRRLHERILEGIGRRLWGHRIRTETAAVIAVDPYARGRALSRGFALERVTMIPSGVDADLYRPGRTSVAIARHRLRGRLLLHVGPLEPGRGHEVLIQAFARTVGQRGDWTLVFVGQGSLRRRLETTAARLGVRGGVRFIPKVEPDELAGLYCAATLLAVPAEDERVRGRQIVRAMAACLPVMASDLPRLAFRIEHEVTGYLVPPGDLRAWTAALERVASSPVAREAWADRARERVLADYSWPQIAARYQALLERVLEGNGKRVSAERELTSPRAVAE
ncbi:glycosyltransferase family 4 protein [Engelhardtia mirabilis]|uniref:D-inositol 3-phosphate glycosyltransferase n=1 Tax=Engelhardtia mirabilis TaxID=2528011 RepID=A0A518BJY6_9BACT|nr:D-inositol 3-phosphate glycosyltransferase [Planctomycetes bacterium Pla133]QDV01610.1 D-inositol 3-phosphate glycosyltransferase [Planctomycetes bacterium Pla86]